MHLHLEHLYTGESLGESLEIFVAEDAESKVESAAADASREIISDANMLLEMTADSSEDMEVSIAVN